jgi:isoquinoline 1-oxidoreductase beta subunit
MTRRDVLRVGSLSGAALLLDVAWSGRLAAGPTLSFRPNARLRIGADGSVSITVGKSEMGQGVRTSLPMLVADELEVDLATVELIPAVPGPEFKRLRTGGSGSIYGSYAALRKAGAAAREMLVSAAAMRWGVDPRGCRAEKASIVHDPTGRRFAYAALVEAASKLPVPPQPRLKEPRDLPILGRPTRRIDGPRIVTGRAVYGLDTRVPGMRQCVVARPPVLGGSVARWDGTRARAVPGVRDLVQVPSGIAVIADDTWAALQGRDALDVTWDDGPHAAFDSAAFRRRLVEAAQGGGHPSRREGAGLAALAGAARRLDATYEYPFQAHAPLETMNTIADVRSRPLRDLVAHPGARAGAGRGGEDPGPRAGGRARERHAHRRRLRAAARDRLRPRGRLCVEGRGRARAGGVDASGRHAPRPPPARLRAPDGRRPRRERTPRCLGPP